MIKVQNSWHQLFSTPVKAMIISNWVKQVELEGAVSVTICCHSSLWTL